jgi:hypothetical protein
MHARRLLRPTGGAALLTAVALLLAGCSSGASSTAGNGSEPGSPGSGSSSSSPSGGPGSEGSSGPTSPSPSGGSDHPVVVRPTSDPLAWRPVPGSTRDEVTVGGDWTLTLSSGGDTARLEGPHPRTVAAGAHSSISDAFLDGSHALVVSEDDLARTPDVATLVDLASGHASTLDRTSSPPTSVGGTWALGPTSLAHATAGTNRRYCVVFLAPDSGRTDGRYCVPPRNGLSRASITDGGTTLMRFDAQHPSCRTLLARSGARFTPLPGVTPCQGWDSTSIPGGVVWSVVPKERRVEAAHFFSHTSAGWFDLGRGTSGTLVGCAGSAYFVRDPATRRDPAALLRWDPVNGVLSRVFTSKGRGNAFLSPPRCGGDHLTVTAFSDAGDQQVTAAVGAP